MIQPCEIYFGNDKTDLRNQFGGIIYRSNNFTAQKEEVKEALHREVKAGLVNDSPSKML